MTIEEFQGLIEWCRDNGVRRFHYGDVSAEVGPHLIGEAQDGPLEPPHWADLDKDFEAELQSADADKRKRLKRERLMYWSAK